MLMRYKFNLIWFFLFKIIESIGPFWTFECERLSSFEVCSCTLLSNMNLKHEVTWRKQGLVCCLLLPYLFLSKNLQFKMCSMYLISPNYNCVSHHIREKTLNMFKKKEIYFTKHTTNLHNIEMTKNMLNTLYLQKVCVYCP